VRLSLFRVVISYQRCGQMKVERIVNWMSEMVLSKRVDDGLTCFP